ncbi:MAG: hypothetical protein JWP74_4190 [Marmoricola sp.]|nr:hypothetical protein [Marmoricola sp.]
MTARETCRRLLMARGEIGLSKSFLPHLRSAVLVLAYGARLLAIVHVDGGSLGARNGVVAASVRWSSGDLGQLARQA